MTPVSEAESLILSLVRPLTETETISLETALNRVLAEPITSHLDFPYWDNSAMDGYAVKFKDVQGCSGESPAVLAVVAEIPAGCQPRQTIQTGQAARIFTGAMLPAGADTVVRQENTRREGDRVFVLSPPDAPKAFIRQQGEFYQRGNILLEPGIAIREPEIAILATAQCSQLAVYRRPRIAILSTGDELVKPEETLQPGKIIDSNQYALAAFVTRQGGVPISFGIVPDCPERLREKISQAMATADFVLSTGGVSVGDYDYVEQILGELGGEIPIRRVAIKPGKPLTVAAFPNGCLYFGLPGNPASALVSCWRFVQPALHKLSGLAGNWQPQFLKAISCQPLRSDGQRETYFWGRLAVVDGTYEFQLAGGSHSSGNLINLAQAEALAVLPATQTAVAAGEEVMVMAVSCL